ncbi:MAG: DUF2779 domain-containing protein [Methylococcales bacterium]
MSQLQCSLKLYLEQNKAHVVEEDKDSPSLINGNAAGEVARSLFPGGVLVETMSNVVDPFEKTKNLMQDASVQTIFEATFLSDGVEVRADIMNRTKEGWDLIEVKSSTKPEDHHLNDAAIQAWVIYKAGVTLSSVSLMHIDRDFDYKGDQDYSSLFITKDITEDAFHRQSRVEQAIEDSKRTVKGKEPKAEMSSHCNKPNGCACKSHCAGIAPSDHISYLPRGHVAQKKMAEVGITRITQIPHGVLKSDTHQMVRQVVMQDKELYIPGIKQSLDRLPYPHHYLDFESVQFAVPRFEGVKPWRQIPFQWSDHVRYSNGNIEHKEFLDVTGDDPRRVFAETLIEECCHDEGAVIVYNKAFEQMIMRDLGNDYPDLKEPLKRISNRCFDMLPEMRNHFYHPDMKGSWSIKKVLPSFIPGMNHNQLETIQSGTEAQVAYLRLTDPNWHGDKVKLEENAREYCKYDTLSMVKLVDGVYERENMGLDINEWRSHDIKTLQSLPSDEKSMSDDSPKGIRVG